MLGLQLLGLYLFASPELVDRINELCSQVIPVRMARRYGLGLVVVATALFALALQLELFGAASETDQHRSLASLAPASMDASQLVAWATLAGSFVWLLLLLPSLVEGRPRLTWVAMLMRNPAHYVLATLLIFMASTPYLGYGSLGRFSDQSGLVTSTVGTNHLFIPHQTQTEFADPIEILASNDPWLESVASSGKRITWFELVRHLSRDPRGKSIDFVRGSDFYQIDDASEFPELSTRPPWLIRKTVAFSIIQKEFQTIRTLVLK